MSDGRVPIDGTRAETLGRYRAGRLSPAEREAFERELLADDALASALYEDESLDALVRRRPRVRAPLPALAAAAVLVLAVGLTWWNVARHPGPAREPVLRGEPAAVRLLEPAAGGAAAPVRFVWTRDPLAASYRFELSDAGGHLVATRMLPDTVLDAADLDAPAPASGSWTVVPIAADGHERPAPPASHFGAPAGR